MIAEVPATRWDRVVAARPGDGDGVRGDGATDDGARRAIVYC